MTTIAYSGGGIAGDWADPKNWAGGKAPGITTDVQVLNGQSMTVGGPISVNAIMIINGGTDTFTGAVTTVGGGNCEGFMVCIGSTVVFAPGSSLTDGGTAAARMGGGVLQVGVGGVGSFIADGTNTLPTTINSTDGTIGKLAAGVGTVTIDDATWTMTGLLAVGVAGTGTLDVEVGGKVNIGAMLSVGEITGAVGAIDVATGGTVDVGTSVSVGEKPAPSARSMWRPEGRSTSLPAFRWAW